MTLAVEYQTKVMMLETEKEVYHKLSGKSRDGRTSLDGEMCNILIGETNKLKGELNSAKQSLGWRENELKQVKRKLRDAEYDNKEARETIDKYKREEERLTLLAKGETKKEFQANDFTPKNTLKKYVDELNKECGKCCEIKRCDIASNINVVTLHEK